MTHNSYLYYISYIAYFHLETLTIATDYILRNVSKV